MTFSERSLLRLHLSGMLIMILLLGSTLGGYFLYRQHQRFTTDLQQIEQQYLRTAEASLQGALETLNQYLQQTRVRTDAELRRELQHLVLSAWSIADGVYQRHQHDWPQERMIEQVRSIISHMHFPDAHGYYFINSLDNRVILAPRQPQLEGGAASAVLDDNGRSIGAALARAVDNPEGEGFARYRWRRPDTGEMAEKISLVRLHKGLGLLIGTGDYLEVIEQRIQQETLQMLAATRIGADGYFAVLDREGRLLLSPAQPLLTGLPLQQLPALQRQGLQAILDSSRAGGGFVRYLWPKRGQQQPEPKLSLVSNLDSWGWILVSGLYLGDMQQELAARRQALEHQRSEALWTSLTILSLAMLAAGTLSVLYSQWMEGRLQRVREHLRHSQQQLHQQRETDELTGLPNQNYLRRHLLQRLRSPGTQPALAMLYIDLDHFKNINDVLGHDTGDALLIAVARRIGMHLGGNDLLCRHAGDEFVLLLDRPQAHETAAIAEFTQQLLHSCAEPFPIGSHTLHITLSIGIACWPADGQDMSELRQNADIALNQAKLRGRNNLQFFDAGMDQRMREHMQLDSQLRQAIREQELYLLYQPKVDLASGQLTGCEALLRWRSRQLGEVSPTRFIPVAEESGLIGEIGCWVLDEACRQLRAWRDAGLPPLRVAVNVSAQQFGQSDLPALVQAALQRHALPASLLELELTESVLAEDMIHLRQTLQQLRAMGVHLTMDDFGTGYSSLSYLNQLQLDTLKIDRAFVQDIHSNREHRELTEAILAMAHSLGMCCVAEGIETDEQWLWLLHHGCEYGQGYRFARPLPHVAISQLLQQQRPLAELPLSLGRRDAMDL